MKDSARRLQSRYAPDCYTHCLIRCYGHDCFRRSSDFLHQSIILSGGHWSNLDRSSRTSEIPPGGAHFWWCRIMLLRQIYPLERVRCLCSFRSLLFWPKSLAPVVFNSNFHFNSPLINYPEQQLMQVALASFESTCANQIQLSETLRRPLWGHYLDA